ncbi:MAG: hypothetical protein AAGE01_25975 [Pseudomonadota bacterium]
MRWVEIVAFASIGSIAHAVDCGGLDRTACLAEDGFCFFEESGFCENRNSPCSNNFDCGSSGPLGPTEGTCVFSGECTAVEEDLDPEAEDGTLSIRVDDEDPETPPTSVSFAVFAQNASAAAPDRKTWTPPWSKGGNIERVFREDFFVTRGGVRTRFRYDGRRAGSSCMTLDIMNLNGFAVDLLYRIEIPIDPLVDPFTVRAYVEGQLTDSDGDGAFLRATDNAGGTQILRAFVASEDQTEFERLPEIGGAGLEAPGRFRPEPLPEQTGPSAPTEGWEVLSVAADVTLSAADSAALNLSVVLDSGGSSSCYPLGLIQTQTIFGNGFER